MKLKKKPSVSVVIPAYNAEATLERCLSSVVHQIFPAMEIIVVDNNSTDSTKRIIENFQKKFPFVKYVFEAHRGRGYARNAGCGEVTGEIVAMTDTDCIVPCDWLQRLTQPIIEEQEQVVMGWQEDLLGNYWTRNIQDADATFLQMKVKGKYIEFLDTKNFAIRCSLLTRFRFHSSLLTCEDWELFLRLNRWGVKIRFLPELRVEHHHAASAKKVFKTQFERGYSTENVLEIHRHDTKVMSRLAAAGIITTRGIGWYLALAPKLVWRFFSSPKKIPFMLVSYLSWEMGAFSRVIWRNFLKIKLTWMRRRLKIQLKVNELFEILMAIPFPSNVLIFGVGNDSNFWHAVNRGGRTVFLEDNEDWWHAVTTKHPYLETYLISYNTKKGEWRELLMRPNELMLELPDTVRDVMWDIIVVDGPAGHSDNTPGRMKSIYTASKIVREGGSIFIHDVEREIESAYSKKFLGEDKMIGEVRGRALLRHYKV